MSSVEKQSVAKAKTLDIVYKEFELSGSGDEKIKQLDKYYEESSFSLSSNQKNSYFTSFLSKDSKEAYIACISKNHPFVAWVDTMDPKGGVIKFL